MNCYIRTSTSIVEFYFRYIPTFGVLLMFLATFSLQFTPFISGLQSSHARPMSSSDSLPYAYRSISSLSPGPQQVSFHGTVTNISSYTIDSKSHRAAKGCLELLLWDENALLLVFIITSCRPPLLDKANTSKIKVWYDQRPYDDILLGHKVKISTMHISSLMKMVPLGSETAAEVPANITTSIFPERDTGCNLEILPTVQHGIVSVPVGSSIIGLDSILEAGHGEKLDPIIVVVVTSIGEVSTSMLFTKLTSPNYTDQAKVTTKTNTTFEVLDLEIIDHTSLHTIPNAQVVPSKLSLTCPLFKSAATFTPKQTVLLIVNPKILSASRRKLTLTLRSQVFVNPDTPDAGALRAWTNRLFPSIPPITLRASLSKQEPFSAQPERMASKRRQYTFSLFQSEITLRQQKQKQKQQKQRRQHHQFHQRNLLTPLVTLDQPRPLKPHKISSSGISTSFTGYISVLITSLPLLYLFNTAQLFHGQCSACKLEIKSSSPTISHVCLRHSEGSQEEVKVETETEVQLHWNSALLAGFADETGGLLLPLPLPSSFPPPLPTPLDPNNSGVDNTKCKISSYTQTHNLQLTETAVFGLTGLKYGDFATTIDRNDDDDDDDDNKIDIKDHTAALLTRLADIETRVRWERVTLVLEYMDGDEIVVLDVLS